MKKVRIGIPRALLYYRYGTLWKAFFENIGCKVILSPETNEEITELGQVGSNKYCQPLKIYLGHALYLSPRTDYVLISNVFNYGKTEKVCSVLSNIYSQVKDIIPKNSILNFNVDYTKFRFEFTELIKLGLHFTKNPIKLIYSYFYAKKKQQYYDTVKENEQNNKLSSHNKKILLISNFYNFNNIISKIITDILKENNITILYSDNLEKQLSSSFSEYFSDHLELKYAREMIGTLYYYRYQIDGVIYLSYANCQQDILINNLSCIKNKYLKTLRVIITENTKDKEIRETISSFLNDIKGDTNE